MRVRSGKVNYKAAGIDRADGRLKGGEIIFGRGSARVRESGSGVGLCIRVTSGVLEGLDVSWK